MPASPPAQQLSNYLAVLDPLTIVAEEMLRLARKSVTPRPRRRGATLRPGLQTPLWNALADLVRPRLAKRGEKSKLARILGVPPQRVHGYFVSSTEMPDAERVLIMLTWLAGQRTA